MSTMSLAKPKRPPISCLALLVIPCLGRASRMAAKSRLLLNVVSASDSGFNIRCLSFVLLRQHQYEATIDVGRTGGSLALSTSSKGQILDQASSSSNRSAWRPSPSSQSLKSSLVSLWSLMTSASRRNGQSPDHISAVIPELTL